jgi:hypothetical protein
VYGIKAAVRRLEFAPKLEKMEVTDIESGRFVFPPRPDQPVSLEDLRKAVTKAGYEIEGTHIEVAGILTADGKLRVPDTGQVFRLEGEEKLRGLQGQAASEQITVAGIWKAQDGEEIIVLEAPREEEGRRP